MRVVSPPCYNGSGADSAVQVFLKRKVLVDREAAIPYMQKPVIFANRNAGKAAAYLIRVFTGTFPSYDTACFQCDRMPVELCSGQLIPDLRKRGTAIQRDHMQIPHSVIVLHVHGEEAVSVISNKILFRAEAIPMAAVKTVTHMIASDAIQYSA